MLARLQALNGLVGVHLRRRTQDHCIHFSQCQAVGKVGGDMADTVLAGHLTGLLQITADQGNDFHAVDILDAVQMLDAEGAGAGQRYLDRLAHVSCSPE
ncbi:hypothetical protein SDC9_211546 [bioreactor metagenome]|uniref:Uncharacterized protein n=1 Tax=bioreactor metagenome TaxID=1076179 RepID=A0A645JKZ5_9ZZZZ